MKVAVTAALPVKVTLQLPVPVQAPDQPANVELAFGAAVSVTIVPLAKLALHIAPQLIPEGLLVIVSCAGARALDGELEGSGRWRSIGCEGRRHCGIARQGYAARTHTAASAGPAGKSGGRIWSCRERDHRPAVQSSRCTLFRS